MVQLNPANQPQVAPARRHTEPPTLWVSVLAGSMLIHTLLFLGLRFYSARTATVEQPPAPISVELVDPGPTTADAASAAPSSPAAAGAAPNLPMPSEPSVSSSVPTPISPTSRVAPLPTPLPSASTIPSPAEAPLPSVPQPDRAPPRSLPPENSFPQPQESPQVPPEVEGTPSVADSGNNTLPSPPPIAPNSGSTPSGGMDSSTGSAADLPSVPVAAERGQGTGIQLTVTHFRSVDDGRDITDALTRQPVLNSTFPQQVYPANVGLNLGEPITIRLLLDTQGRPKQIIAVLQGGSAQEYTQLAQELLQQVQFPPVTQQGIPVERTVDVTLKLDPVR